VGDRPLKELFTRLYSVSDSKEMVVSEMGDWISKENRKEFIWMLSWRRGLFVWEQGLKRQLVSEISTMQWNKVALDVWCWMGGYESIHSPIWL